MAKTVLTNAAVKVGSTLLSDHVKSVTLSMNTDDVDLTAMGDTAHTHAPGLRDDQIDVEFYQDFAASSLDSVLSALVGSATGATIVVNPNGTATSSTNPSYTMVGVLFNYNPIDGAVGSASMTKVSFKPAAGSYITRATT